MVYSRTWIDYDGESTTFRARTAALTAANYDAQLTLQSALNTAMAGITRGHVTKTAWGNEITAGATPDDPLSQRENKWLIRYHDAVTDDAISPMELGCADLTVLDPNNRGYAEMGDGDVVDAFVTAFEAYVLSPLGNAVVVDSLQFVGRNT